MSSLISSVLSIPSLVSRFCLHIVINLHSSSLSSTILCSTAGSTQSLSGRFFRKGASMECSPGPQLMRFQLVVIPPQPSSLKQSLTFALQPDFTLNFETNSLIGSRAKLADVPKIHDVIESQIRRFLVQHGTWTIVLPPLDPEQHIGSPDGGEL